MLQGWGTLIETNDHLGAHLYRRMGSPLGYT